MNVLILGGTSFVGYHCALECLKRGHQVTALALPPAPPKRLLPREVKIILANSDTLNDKHLKQLLNRHDAVVHATGADNHVISRQSVYSYFSRTNMVSAARLFSLARKVGVSRGVLLSSYFCHFDQQWPELKLSIHHPYIRSRLEQAKQSLEAAQPSLDLMVLQIPYIVGSMPGQDPLWKPLINYLRSPFPVYCPQGGTNMIAADLVAEAIVGALEKGNGGETYLVGDENHSWHDFLIMLQKELGIDREINPIPNSLVRRFMESLGVWHRMQGKESGLNPHRFVKIFTKETYFDASYSREALGYGQGGLQKALAQTVAACPDNMWRFINPKSLALDKITYLK